MAGTAPTLDASSVAPVSDAEIDAFARRVIENLRKRPGRFCAKIDTFYREIGELLEGVERNRRERKP